MIATDFLFKNSILNSAFIACFLAQFLKVLFSFKNYRFDFSRMTASGGMPSSHSSTVLALTTSVYKIFGHQSAEYAISLILSIIVMYDATGVRRAAGEQAKIINYLMNNFLETTPQEFTKELKELIGHTPKEVVAGAILGIFTGIYVVKL